MSTPSSPILPLRERKHDYLFVFAFSFFAFSSFFSDLLHGLDLIDATSFWGRANLWYVQAAGDDFLIADNDFARYSTFVSAFVYGPFYLVLVASFVKGWNAVRIPAFLYVGAMLHGYLEFMWWEYSLGHAPRVPAVFWAFNLPYGIIPTLLAVRMWKPEPFSRNGV